MLYSLAGWHINPRKLGQILKQLFKEGGYSIAYVSRDTGISRDTIENILAGKIQEVSYEKLQKICCSIRVPLTVVKTMVFQDEPVDFLDRVFLVDATTGEIVSFTDIDRSQLPVPETVVAAAEAVAAAEKPLEPTRPTKTTEEYIAFLQAHIDRLTALLEISMRGHDK